MIISVEIALIDYFFITWGSALNYFKGSEINLFQSVAWLETKLTSTSSKEMCHFWYLENSVNDLFMVCLLVKSMLS